jgi:hypothetical protein
VDFLNEAGHDIEPAEHECLADRGSPLVRKSVFLADAFQSLAVHDGRLEWLENGPRRSRTRISTGIASSVAFSGLSPRHGSPIALVPDGVLREQ